MEIKLVESLTVLMTIAMGPAAALGDQTTFSPAPDSVVQTAYPVVTATVGESPANPDEVALSVDGCDVTGIASFDGHRITYVPVLAPGRHSVVFTARAPGGRIVSTQWSFVVRGNSVFGNNGTALGIPLAQPSNIVVAQPWWPGGWRASLPGAVKATTFGNSSLFLTSDPRLPQGQTVVAPIVPVYQPRNSFRTIIYPPPFPH